MSLILAIETDARRCHRIEEALAGTAHRLLAADTLARGMELSRNGSPDLIFVGTPKDADTLSAISHIRKEGDAKETPIVLLGESTDPAILGRLKQLSVLGVLSPEAPLDQLRRKVLAAVAAAEKMQLEQALKRSHHVNVKRAQGQTRITILSGLREHALGELKVVLNAFFLKLIRNDLVILDLRHIPEIPPGDARLIEQIVTVLGADKVLLVCGKHLGLLVSNTDLASSNKVFLSEEELNAHLQKK